MNQCKICYVGEKINIFLLEYIAIHYKYHLYGMEIIISKFVLYFENDVLNLNLTLLCVVKR